MEQVLIALGSNLGDRLATLRAAVTGLAPVMHVRAASPVYESAPMYDQDQDRYLNMAVAGTTALAPRALLGELKGVERGLGRERSRRYGPRLIDLDIVLYGRLILHEPGLEIPHPRMAERGFVLIPAADIAAAWTHPASGRTVEDLRDALGPVPDVAWHAPAPAVPGAA